MAKSDILPFQIATVPLILLTINQYMGYTNQLMLFCISLAVEIVLFLAYVSKSINQICDCLGIYCFTIKRKGE